MITYLYSIAFVNILRTVYALFCIRVRGTVQYVTVASFDAKKIDWLFAGLVMLDA